MEKSSHKSIQHFHRRLSRCWFFNICFRREDELFNSRGASFVKEYLNEEFEVGIVKANGRILSKEIHCELKYKPYYFSSPRCSWKFFDVIGSGDLSAGRMYDT